MTHESDAASRRVINQHRAANGEPPISDQQFRRAKRAAAQEISGIIDEATAKARKAARQSKAKKDKGKK